MSVFFTPGPSQLFPTVATHLQSALVEQIGSINHRSTAFRTIYKSVDESLRALMQIPDTHAIFFAGSATEIWERILFNTVDEHSFHLVNGSFSKRFYEYAQLLQKQPCCYEMPHGSGFDMHTFEVPTETELICTTQNETSSGVRIPPADLCLLKQKYPNKLLCTDLVSSAPLEPIDFAFVDMAFFSVQKAFGLPPGLGVWIVHEQCLQKFEQLRNKNRCTGAHHTLDAYFKNYKNFETPSTPNVLSIYLLDKIARDLLHTGRQQLLQDAVSKKELLDRALPEIPYLSHVVRRTEHQSFSTIVLQTSIEAKTVIEQIQHKLDFVIGSGYGPYKQTEIRIANFPATSLEQMQILIDGLKTIG